MSALSECFQNKLVDTIHFMDNLNSKDSAEKDTFFRNMPTLAEQLPRQIVLEKLLPLLAAALDFDAVIAPALTALLKIGAWLSAEEFSVKVLPTIVKLFASNDQAIRVTLLQHIDEFGELLSSQVVEEQVYPHVASGFSATSAILRELTLTSMLVLAPKLSQLTISGSLLKFLSELEVDKEPEIRKCTTILLGKLASHLNGGTRNEVLLKAFAVRALHDSFSFVKTAGIMALCATSSYYGSPEIASSILPKLVQLTIDPDSDVQSKAIHAVDHFWHILKQQHHEKTDGGASGGASRIGIPSIAGNASVSSRFAIDIEMGKKLKIARGAKTRNNVVPIEPDNVSQVENAGGKFCDKTPPVTGGRFGTIRIHFKSLQSDVILPIDEYELYRFQWLKDYLEKNPTCKTSYKLFRKSFREASKLTVDELKKLNKEAEECTKKILSGDKDEIQKFVDMGKLYYLCEFDGYPSHPGLDPCFDCASFQRQRNCGKKAAVSEVLELEVKKLRLLLFHDRPFLGLSKLL